MVQDRALGQVVQLLRLQHTLYTDSIIVNVPYVREDVSNFKDEYG